MATSMTRGVVMIHSAPRALCPHLEWAVGRALGRAVSFDWADQPVLPGARRAEQVGGWRREQSFGRVSGEARAAQDKLAVALVGEAD